MISSALPMHWTGSVNGKFGVKLTFASPQIEPGTEHNENHITGHQSTLLRQRAQGSTSPPHPDEVNAAAMAAATELREFDAKNMSKMKTFGLILGVGVLFVTVAFVVLVAVQGRSIL